MAPPPSLCRPNSARPADCCLDPQAHARYGQHHRYADRPLNGVVTDHGYDYGGDNKYVADGPSRAPCTAGLAHSSLLLAVRQAQSLARGLACVK
jgi:hypothetical protein